MDLDIMESSDVVFVVLQTDFPSLLPPPEFCPGEWRAMASRLL